MTEIIPTDRLFFMLQSIGFPDLFKLAFLESLLIFGFICYPEISAGISGFFTNIYKKSKNPYEANRFKINPSLENKTIPNFYTQKWKIITELIPDKLHSHIGGFSATKLYIDKLNLKSTDTLLDIGCGYGGMLILATQTRRCNGIGIDLINDRVYKAREAAIAEGVDNNLEFFIEDFMTWRQNPPGLFDATTILDVLMHVQDKEKFILKISTLLKPKGKAIIADYFFKKETSSYGNPIFDDPAIYHPFRVCDFFDVINKSELSIKWEKDLTLSAIKETERLIDAIQRSNSEISSKYPNRLISKVSELLSEWFHLFSEKQLCYKAFMVQKIV